VPLVRVRGQPFEALVGRTGPRGPACLRGPPWFPRAIRGRSSPGRRYWGLAEGWAGAENALSIETNPAQTLTRREQESHHGNLLHA
jgi:hypothetical protein